MSELNKLYQLVEKLNMGGHWKTYIDAFIFGCRMKNLSPKRLEVFAERLGCLARYLKSKDIDIEDVI